MTIDSNSPAYDAAARALAEEIDLLKASLEKERSFTAGEHNGRVIAEAAFATLELLNESRDHVFALTFNPLTRKWIILRMYRVEGEQKGQFEVRSISAGNTPNIACRDALVLRYAPEPTIPEAVSTY